MDDEAFIRIERRHRRRTWLAVLAMAVVGIFFATLVKAGTIDGRRIVIIDGDTIDIRGERIRILNIDAPESFNSRCEAELKLALRTKQRLAQLLRRGSVEIDRRGEDRARLPATRSSSNAFSRPWQPASPPATARPHWPCTTSLRR